MSKIILIEQAGNVFTVTFRPHWFKRMLGAKNKVKRYKDTGQYYKYGNGRAYIDEDNRLLGVLNPIGNHLDRWRLGTW